MTPKDFEDAVRAAGLYPYRCLSWYWQIRGGHRIVNCWVLLDNGIRYQEQGQPAVLGTVADAIKLAKDRPCPECGE